VADPADRRTVRRRRWWQRSALPRSRPALALGAVVAVVLLVLLLLGLTRARPGRDVPFLDPTVTTSTRPRGPVEPPSMTTTPKPAAVAVPATRPPRDTTTTRRR